MCQNVLDSIPSDTWNTWNIPYYTLYCSNLIKIWHQSWNLACFMCDVSKKRRTMIDVLTRCCLAQSIIGWMTDTPNFRKSDTKQKRGKKEAKKRGMAMQTQKPTDATRNERNETQNDQQNHDATKKAPRKDDPRNYRLANNNCGETSRSTTS